MKQFYEFSLWNFSTTLIQKNHRHPIFAQKRCFATIIKIKIRFNVSSVEKDFSKSMSSHI
ncbi:hypothetical protein LEP1GSC166_4084 [Leptospira kirschneri]|nr:hypothetical protein LEP1GSC166_4084 [Leptospira kirschneri]